MNEVRHLNHQLQNQEVLITAKEHECNQVKLDLIHVR
jgi:hypothetical protein